MTPLPRAAALASLLACVAPVAEAQTAPAGPFRPRSAQLTVGVAGLTGTDFGETRASLTGNENPPVPYTLFEAESTIRPAAGFEARLGYMLTRSLGVEGALLYSRPRLETRVSGDVEGASPVTAFTDVSQYMVDVSGVWHLNAWRFGRNGVPFLLGGGGYLRQLYDGRTLVETGWTAHGGGGITYAFRQRPRGLLRGLALRADARVYVRSGGVELDDDIARRVFATGGAGLAVLF